MPFGYALPSSPLGYQPTAAHPVPPSWVGPYYASDGSHVWHLSNDPGLQPPLSPPAQIPRPTYGLGTSGGFPGTVWGLPGDPSWSPLPRTQYARREGAKGIWSPTASMAQATSPNLWLRRSFPSVFPPGFVAQVGLAGIAPAPQQPIGLSYGPWEVACTASLNARQWNCPVRGTVYPPVQPTQPSFGVSGHVGQFAPSAGPGYYWQQRQLAPYAGPGYHWGPPAQIPQPVYPPSWTQQQPTPPICPPGYIWLEAQTYQADPFFGGNTKYFPGGCCNPKVGAHDCVPPINTPPPAYNPCQPGWSYDAQAKKCCPPGYHWSTDFQQCVPVGSPKGY